MLRLLSDETFNERKHTVNTAQQRQRAKRRDAKCIIISHPHLRLPHLHHLELLRGSRREFACDALA